MAKIIFGVIITFLEKNVSLHWKKLSATILMFFSASCFGEEVTLYNEKGVSFKYKYEKVSTSVDKDCPGVEFDEYVVSVKVENKNGKAIDADQNIPGGILSGRLYFNSFYCQSGNVQSSTIPYDTGVFTLHRSYGSPNPINPNFGIVNSYFLDANDHYATPNYNVAATPNIKILKGKPFPKPVDWNFPKWVFIDIPGKTGVTAAQQLGTTTTQQPAKSVISTSGSPILGKWCLKFTLTAGRKMRGNCGQWTIDVTQVGKWKNTFGGQADLVESEWRIDGNFLYLKSGRGPSDDKRYEILVLSDSALELKLQGGNTSIFARPE